MSHDSIVFLLFILGLITGFIGTNTGGSVLVTVPIMIWLGISPQSAIASARVASIGTMVAGLRQFYKNGKVDFYLA
ncbi:MAG: TSUP family transporter, partial [Rickettsia endosymbiont of Labidopullus appendiculatus]|nr:TSUP family transporter [Rickettsia endosymbiont of Labidopullus appendiculatus]